MENLISCVSCGRFFQQTGLGQTCPECLEQNMGDFEKIREYLIANPRAKLLKVATELDVPVAKIKLFLREGRLEIVEKDNLFLKCEGCGKPICSGVYCDDCSRQYNHGYKSLFNESANNGIRTKAAINYKKVK